jgi:enoyl-[acyl-carrier protein] reductase I
MSAGYIENRTFDEIRVVLEEERKAPLGRLPEIDDVGAMAAFLASPAARALTGMTVYVDGGYHIMG